MANRRVRMWHESDEPGAGLLHGKFGDPVQVEEERLATYSGALCVNPFDKSEILAGPIRDEGDTALQWFEEDVTAMGRLYQLRAMEGVNPPATSKPVRWVDRPWVSWVERLAWWVMISAFVTLLWIEVWSFGERMFQHTGR